MKFTPDIIYHLGEYSRVEQSFEDIEKVWEYNKNGIFAVLEFVRKTGAKIVYAGSSTKFGDGGLGRNQSPYAWSKATNTELVQNYASWYNISYAITYFYNVYGKREISTGKYATLIALFKERMKNKEDLTIVSPGTQKRNFTHIDDIVDGLILVGENGYGDEFGIGSPESFTILEIAEMFGGTIKMLPERRGNRMTADVMTTKTEALGWSAKRNIKDYIENLKKSNWK
ncbi:dTDP-L-rhamnose 4-epimerase [Arcobacter porcinus]|nr:dTDP-L-rhamnose 4-epimerase [Arcobacter porcinus]